MTAFDKRFTPGRPDLASSALAGRYAASAYVDPWPQRIAAPIADLKAEPRFDLPNETQAIRGELVDVLEVDGEGWAWVQLRSDGYVGYLPADTLGPVDPEPTHVVAALRTFAFSGPDLKTPVACHLVQNAAVTVVATFEKRNLRYAELSDGTYTVLRHLTPLGASPEPDYVSVAEAYVGVPYLWGGRTSLGIDCSALVQVALARAGVKAPRDTDVQEATLGAPVDWKGDVDALVRGDLVFWKGHVGMVAGPNRLLHANGFHMATAFEPIDAAIARIAASGLAVRAVRRP